MALTLGVPEITLSIIVGTLAAIVYSLRVLVLLDRRIERVEKHIEKIAGSIVQEEFKIEKALHIKPASAAKKNKRSGKKKKR